MVTNEGATDPGTAATAGATTPSPAGSGNRNRSRNTNLRVHEQRATGPARAKFEGRCEALKHAIYDCSDSRQATQFNKTTEEIAVYVGKEYAEPNDIRQAVLQLKLPTVTKPVPVAKPDDVDDAIFKEEIKQHVSRKYKLATNVQKLYALVWGQCSEALQQKVEASTGFDIVSSTGNGIDLLKTIKTVCYKFQSQKYWWHAMRDATKRLYTCFQSRTSTVQEYFEEFQSIVDVITSSGGSVNAGSGGTSAVATEQGIDIDTAGASKTKELAELSDERYLAMLFLLGADRTRYGKLIEDLENGHLQGSVTYPKTIRDAYSLLVNWKQQQVRPPNHTPVNSGIAFTNDGSENEGSQPTMSRESRRAKYSVTCTKCGKRGHYANECRSTAPDKSELNVVDGAKNDDTECEATMLLSGIDKGEFDQSDGFHFMHNSEETSHTLSQGGRIPESWILLDNQSTVDVFANQKLLTNIRTSDTTMTIHCNAGTTTTKLVGDLHGYGTVWFHPKGIANIISVSRAIDLGHSVAFDSSVGNSFKLTKPDGTHRVFKQSSRGLFYMDTCESTTGTTLINTVVDNTTNYSARSYSQAKLARTIQRTIGRPSTAAFIDIVDRGQLLNCPITREDIIAAEKIFGPDVGALMGKTVRHNTTHVAAPLSALPMSIAVEHRVVTLCGDVMFVNQIPFLVTISRNIKFGTVEALGNARSKTIAHALLKVQKVYQQRGFQVATLLMDGQFEPCRLELSSAGISLNVASRNEHVPEVERYIRTIKERARCIFNTLPFTGIPPRMVVELVYSCVFWLNSFPATNGVSTSMSPRSIVTGTSLDYNKHCRLEFGTYVQTHEEHNNSMAPRTTGAIALRPTGNLQGGHYFFSLTTGRVLNRYRWTTLPVPSDVIQRLQSLSGDKTLMFSNRDGVESYERDDGTDDDPNLAPIDGVDNYDEFNPGVDVTADPGVNPHADPGVDTTDNPGVEVLHEGVEVLHEEPDLDDQGVNVEQTDAIVVDQDDLDMEQPEPEADAQAPEATQPPEPEFLIDDIEQRMDAAYGARTSDHNLRPRKEPDFSHLHSNIDGLATLESIAMTQHSMKQGIKLFGNDGINAVLKELKQLHDLKVIKPQKSTDMTKEEKHRALNYLMFLKKKRNGTIKGRGCADGRKQRAYTAKEEASSPTVSTESLMISCTIDAKEKRDVATVDIPGAFLQADMDETVHMKLTGTMMDLMVKIDPSAYQEYVCVENGQRVLYVILVKALYGTLKAALLFWKKLSDKLIEWGFKTNAYDRCVANKTINGKQCTILWHVDDLKISHKDPKVVSDIIKQIEGEFAKEAPLTIKRGKVHDYLGMTIDYTIPGKVQIKMDDYIENMLAELPDDMDGAAPTPAADHLFAVDESAVKLGKEQSEMFHHNVAKLLFLCKRSRPDVQTAVAFLCTRVRDPDEDDQKKLVRVMKYLRGTPNLPLTLEGNDMGIIKWWVDASFAVHPDMRSHTGATLMFGKGSVIGVSTRQKINTRSSTEAELVAVNDVMPQIMWTRYFLEEQGYEVSESIVYQDNMSSILLEKNGKASSSKRTRHINIRYFFVTDKVKSKELTIVYCPTGDMIADFFTKPLQGATFRKLRALIMNIPPSDEVTLVQRSVLKDPSKVNECHCDHSERRMKKVGWAMPDESYTGLGKCQSHKWMTITAEGRKKPK